VQKGLVQMEAWSSSAEGPRPNGGMEQECRGASSCRGHGVVVQRGLVQNGGLVHTSAALKLCCSAFPYLCLIIISKYNSNKEYKI
jgi:hypothetical protein